MLFQVVGSSGRPLTCATYDVEFGFELRLFYSGRERRRRLGAVGVVRGADHEDRVAEAADAWHLALIEKDFKDIEVS